MSLRWSISPFTISTTNEPSALRWYERDRDVIGFESVRGPGVAFTDQERPLGGRDLDLAAALAFALVWIRDGQKPLGTDGATARRHACLWNGIYSRLTSASLNVNVNRQFSRHGVKVQLDYVHYRTIADTSQPRGAKPGTHSRQSSTRAHVGMHTGLNARQPGGLDLKGKVGGVRRTALFSITRAGRARLTLVSRFHRLLPRQRLPFRFNCANMHVQLR